MVVGCSSWISHSTPKETGSPSTVKGTNKGQDPVQPFRSSTVGRGVTDRQDTT